MTAQRRKLLRARAGSEDIKKVYGLKAIARAVGKAGKVYGIDITPEIPAMSRRRVEQSVLAARAMNPKGVFLQCFRQMKLIDGTSVKPIEPENMDGGWMSPLLMP